VLFSSFEIIFLGQTWEVQLTFLANEALVVAHKQLSLKLFHRIQHHPNHNQQAGAGDKQRLSLATN
jgi:hypothetical protein